MSEERRQFSERERLIADLILNEIKRLLEELRNFENENASDLTELDEAGIGNPVTDLRFALTSLIEIFQEFLEFRDSEHALRSLMALSLVSGQPEAVTDQLATLSNSPGIGSGIRNAASSLVHSFTGFFSRLKSAIQSISTKLWTLLSNYLKLKEWSIKGTVTTPALVSLFGITAGAELQVTFEK